MIIQCRIDDKISHTVVWEKWINYRVVEMEKNFNNFMDASGFVNGLMKKNIRVLGIINNHILSDNG